MPVAADGATMPPRAATSAAEERAGTNPASRNTEDQKGMSRHIRGSLMTGKAGFAEFVPEGLNLRAPASPIAAGRSIWFEIEFAPILPVASASGENFVVQVRNDARFPKPPLVVGFRLHQMERSVASESNQRVPATLEVPLRCMPSTRIATLPERAPVLQNWRRTRPNNDLPPVFDIVGGSTLATNCQ